VHYKIRQRFDSVTSKHAHTKKSETERLAELEVELQHAKQQYQLSALETIAKLKDSQVLANTEFLERTCAFLYAQKAFFHQGSHTYAILAWTETETETVCVWVALKF
jgi:hypothetical protein